MARLYLEGLGYDIIGVRWKCRLGEIDLIARDGGTIVFVEVRARGTVEQAIESVGAVKRRRVEAELKRGDGHS